jgi:predicted nucleic acid-binding protein
VKFADTSWWVAWSLPSDGRHDDALSVMRHVGATERILTTNGIVGETWTFLRRKDGHSTAVAYLDRVTAPARPQQEPVPDPDQRVGTIGRPLPTERTPW